MKIAFFWTWDFSRNILESILSYDNIDVSLIVSQPDKLIWRKKILTKTPVKILWEEKWIPVFQPEKLKWNIEFFNKLEWLDFIIVVAYWKIVPIEVLNAPKFGCINIHGSILPKYRWASPIQESIKNWDKKTWLTIMYMSEWTDEWDILNIEEVNIDINDKTNDIFKKFELIWPKLLLQTLNWILDWKIKWRKQNDELATYCSKITKKDWEINFYKNTSLEIYNKYRAYYNWPWIYTYYNNKKLSIENCYFDEENTIFDDDNFWPWDIIEIEESWKKDIWIICKKWILILKEVKLEWKKKVDIQSFINWNKDFLNYKF